MASLRVKLLIFGLLFTSALLVSCQDEEDDAGVPDVDIEGLNAMQDSERTLDGAEDEAPDAEVENGVLVLTDDNFDSVVNSKEIILVEFYAPWCGHCKALAPKYEAAAQRLKDSDPPVALAKLDATENRDSAGRFEVSGYPTLKYFRNGKPYPYEGPREEDGIVEYMQKRADPSWEEPPDAVIVLTQENFTDITQREELMLVEFYAPWCGHCKKLAPEYEKAAQELKMHDPPILLAKVDATAETEVAQEYGVSGYPTMKVFRKGKASEYKGERTQYGIVDYMYNQVGDASKLKEDLRELQKFFKKDDVSIVGFFNGETDKEYQLYQEAVNELRQEYEFAHTFNQAARDKYKVNPGTVVVFNAERFYTKHEPKWHTLPVQADTTAEDIQSFITGHNTPLVGHYTMESKEKRYPASKRPLVLFFYFVDWSFDHRDATQLWRKKIAAIATEYRDLTFAIANEEDFPDVVKSFGFEESGEDLNMGVLDAKDNKFPMDPIDEFDADEIKEFLDKYKKGKLKPRIKSQPVPKKQSGPVKVVVGKNFDQVVKDPTKDVLIEFYAPWCGHCKKLEPIYKDLAKKYKKAKNLVIAKMDATANDYPPQYEVGGFPTLYWVPTNDKENPIKYNGGRELEDLDKYLVEHATVPLGKAAAPKEEL